MHSAWSWVAIGGGKLAIGHRPKVKTLAALAEDGATHVLTLLSEREGAIEICDAARAAGLVSIWLPLASARPDEADESAVRATLKAVRAVLMSGGGVFVHCSAGIHRTGMIALALLRSMGIERTDAMTLLTELRPFTAEGVGTARAAWADRFGAGS